MQNRDAFWQVLQLTRIVQVAREHFTESSPEGHLLARHRGQAIRLPKDRALWPGQTFLAWHRKHRYRGEQRI